VPRAREGEAALPAQWRVCRGQKAGAVSERMFAGDEQSRPLSKIGNGFRGVLGACGMHGEVGSVRRRQHGWVQSRFTLRSSRSPAVGGSARPLLHGAKSPDSPFYRRAAWSGDSHAEAKIFTW